jgi:hypothetical protein
MGSESFYVDGPCESVSYDYSDNGTAGLDASYDEDTEFDSGDNTVTLSADGLQDMFPYAAELEVRYDGHTNFFESQMTFVDNFTTHDWDFTFDVPSFVCDVTLYARLYVKTDTYSNSHLQSIDVHDADGPCDGTDGDARLSAPLYANVDGTWTIVDDDTTLVPGTYEMQWDISWMGDTEYYFSANAPNWGWSDYVTADDGPIEWTLHLDEFECHPQIYSYMRQHSDFSGWHYYDSTYLYPDTECIEDAGEITLEVDGVVYESGQGYDYELMPGTTNFSWNLTGLLEGYEYEMQWYRGGSECCEHQYEYFTADSTGNAWFDFDLTIDEHECDVYYNGNLYARSAITGDNRNIAHFSFYPQEPCVPVFDLVAADDDGNMTLDALDEGFALSPGWNELAIDLSEMGDGNEYRVEWYYEDSNSWNGWYYDDLYVNSSDPDSYMLHFDLWMDDMDCDAHLYARV